MTRRMVLVLLVLALGTLASAFRPNADRSMAMVAGGMPTGGTRAAFLARAFGTTAVVFGGAAVAVADADTTALNRELLDKAGPMQALCLGFGCGGANGLSYNGAEAPEGEESISITDFMSAIKDNKVQSVELLPPNGDVAYAILDTGRIRIGEGMPTEQSHGWSSPLYVVQMCENAGVPYKFSFTKPAYKPVVRK